MSTQGTIKRFTLLIEKLSSGRGPSFEALKDYLEEHGFSISPRTLQRDIEQIRNEFGVEIHYDRVKRGYFISNDEGAPSEGLVRFLEILGTAELLGDQLKSGEELNQYVSFEAQGNLRGIENLGLLLPAIKTKRKVEFVHENYESGKRTKYLLQPYLLREYLNRWYVFGKVESLGKLRTFGVDRIQELVVKRETFRTASDFDPKSYFEDLIGLNYSDSEVEDIRMVTDKVQAKYLMALPLHKSQRVISEKYDEVVFSLMVKPNYEFKQRILMLMDRIKVLEPKWLVEEIKGDIKKMGRRYGR